MRLLMMLLSTVITFFTLFLLSFSRGDDHDHTTDDDSTNDFDDDDDDYKSKWANDFYNATIWDLKTGYEDEGYEHDSTRCARQDNQEN